jgi:hypothetical protein
VLVPEKVASPDLVEVRGQKAAFDVAEAAPTMRVASIEAPPKNRLAALMAPVVLFLLAVTGYLYWRSEQMSEAPGQPSLTVGKGQKSSDLKGTNKMLSTAVPPAPKAEHQVSEKDRTYPTNQIVSASLMISRPFSTITTEAGVDYRCFNFPKDVAIGLISSNSGGPPVRAVGQMKFRADELITFNPADVVERFPKCLKRFQSGDIYCAKFINDHDSDDLVEAISTIPGIQMLDFDQCWDMTPACLDILNKFDDLRVFSCQYSNLMVPCCPGPDVGTN